MPKAGPRTRKRRSPENRESDQSGSLGFMVWRGFPDVMRRAHQHTDVEFNFVLEGAIGYLVGGRRTVVEPLTFTGLWAGTPHFVVSVAPGTQCIWTTVPLAWFIGYGLPAGFTDLVLGGELVREPDAQARELDRLLHERWVSDHESREPDRVRSSMLEVEARIRRLAVSLGAPRRRRAGRAAAAGTAGQAAPVERIAEHLARHYREQLTVAEVAGASGLHPNYAMMLFKQSFGLSIWEYLTRLRLSHAQRLLVTTDEKVLEVALDAGFSSLSRFYDIFQSRVGCTPSAYRETHTKKA